MIVYPAIPFPPAPPIIIVKQVVTVLTALNWNGMVGTAYKIRHARNRMPLASEMPCISVGIVADELYPDGSGSANTQNETIRVLRLDLQIDKGLPTEQSNTDPTGWDDLMRAALLGYEGLRTGDGLPMTDYVWDTLFEEYSPNEDSNSDQGRLVCSVSMIYRVSTERPSRLLCTGVSYDD